MNKFTTLSGEVSVILIRKTTCFFFAVGILMSHQVWLIDRFFPVLPVFNWKISTPYPVDKILLTLLVVLLIIGFLKNLNKVFIFLFVVLTVVLLQDQMRWQPWVYLFFLILIPFSLKETKKVDEQLINYFQIIVIGVYVWSGLQKFNPNFIAYTFEEILTKLLNVHDKAVTDRLSALGYCIPLIEVFIGACLTVPWVRNVGVYLAIFAHLIILICLSPLGLDSNSIVYPWNIAMIIIVFTTFYNVKYKVKFWDDDKRFRILNLLAVILIWILPFFNFLGKWDHYLSFSLYSDKPSVFYIAIADDEIRKLPDGYDRYFAEIEGMTGGKIIDVERWSTVELNVPFYPEKRVFEKLSRTFCNLGIKDDQLIFVEVQRLGDDKKHVTFQCKDLTE